MQDLDFFLTKAYIQDLISLDKKACKEDLIFFFIITYIQDLTPFLKKLVCKIWPF